MSSFDDYLDNQIKFGRYQIEQFIVTMISIFNIAFIEFFFIQIVEVIKKEMDLSNEQLELFHSTFFLGMTMGFMICIFCKDRFGRKKLILMSYGIISLSSFVSSLVYNIYILILARMGIGMSFSIAFSLSYICWVEIMPTCYRGKGIVIGEIIFVLGILYNAVIVSIFFVSYDEANWRLILQVHVVLSLIGFMANVMKMKESPRILLIQRKYSAAFDIMEHMLKKNGCKEGLSSNAKEKLQEWSEEVTKEKKVRIREIFAAGTRKTTGMLWLVQVLVNIVDKGILALMPVIFEETHQNVRNLFWMYVPELFSVLVSYKIVDSKRYFGRKKGFQLGFAILILPFLVILAIQKPAVYWSYLVVRFAIRCIWIFNCTLSIESYNTQYRTIGVSSAQSVGKLFGGAAPFIVLPIYFHHQYYVFLYLSLLCVLAIVVLKFFPKDKTMEPIDEAKEEKGQSEEKVEMNAYLQNEKVNNV